MAGRPLTSPWWTHFEKVDGTYMWFAYFPIIEQFSGDFRLVRCLHCNKEVQRGKEGCSTREASNSGMASHMRSKHSGEAIQVVILTFTLNSWKIHSSQVQQRLNAARRSSTELNEDKKDETVRGSLPLFNFDLGWLWIALLYIFVFSMYYWIWSRINMDMMSSLFKMVSIFAGTVSVSQFCERLILTPA